MPGRPNGHRRTLCQDEQWTSRMITQDVPDWETLLAIAAESTLDEVEKYLEESTELPEVPKSEGQVLKSAVADSLARREADEIRYAAEADEFKKREARLNAEVAEVAREAGGVRTSEDAVVWCADLTDEHFDKIARGAANVDRLLAAAFGPVGAEVQKRKRQLHVDELARQQLREEHTDAQDWEPLDLATASEEPEAPEFGVRVDGARCFYRGRLNTVFGESEGGKSWLAFLACAQAVREGGSVLLIDYEDSQRAVARRLRLLGLTDRHLSSQVTYFNPTSSFTDEIRERIKGSIESADIVVIDATTEALAAEGLNSNQDTEVAEFINRFPKWCAALGPAVILIDHIPKSSDNKAGPTGSQMKRASVDGSALRVENVENYSSRGGGVGRSRIWVNKDKQDGVNPTAAANRLWAELVNDASDGFLLALPTPVLSSAEKEAAKAFSLASAVEQALREGHTGKSAVRHAVRDAGVKAGNDAIDRAYEDAQAGAR
jgi:hypothetical protein